MIPAALGVPDPLANLPVFPQCLFGDGTSRYVEGNTMLERIPETPEILEPWPEFSQVTGEFRRQGLEHGLVPRPETTREPVLCAAVGSSHQVQTTAG